MMNLCDVTHQQICFAGDVCPLCESLDIIYNMKEEAFALEDDRQRLLEQINQLKKNRNDNEYRKTKKDHG